MGPRIRLSELGVYERAYVGARFALGLVFVLVFVTGEIDLVAPAAQQLVLVATILSTATTIVVFLAMVWFGRPARPVLLSAMVPDLIGISLAVAASQGAGDPAYVWVVGFAIVYALLLPPAESIVASMSVAAVYFASYGLAASMTGPVPWATQVAKALGVVAIGHFSGLAVRTHSERERELVSRQQAIQRLNARLQHRLDGLNAVIQISEELHSSLELAETGPRVIGLIDRLFRVPVSAVTIAEPERTEAITLRGSGIEVFPHARGADLPDEADDHMGAEPGRVNSKIVLLENPRVLVVLYVDGGYDQSGLSQGTRLALQAVAGELAIAVDNWRLYRLTKRLSITDELTGLYNYRHLRAKLDEEVQRVTRYGRPMSLIMFDVDRFKEFNDQHGHLAGDAALAELGIVVGAAVRDIDTVARYGGEEFVIILPETSAEAAMAAAEKVRALIAQHRFADAKGQRKFHLNVSLGVASMPNHAGTARDLIREADAALYRAKSEGRDRVVVCGDDPQASAV